MSRRARITVALAALVAACISVAGGAADGVNPVIAVNYRPSCTFSVVISGQTADANGPPGISIPPGSYDVVISTTLPDAPFDPPPSGCVNIQFSLTGAGVSWSSTLNNQAIYSDRGTVTLLPSSVYTAVDGNHPAQTTRVFSTTATGSSASLLQPGHSSVATTSVGQTETGIVGSGLAPFRGTLRATVAADGTSQLLSGGDAVTALQAGAYTIVAKDASKISGFFLKKGYRKPTVITTAAFEGTKSVSVTISAGKWTYFSKSGTVGEIVVG